MTCLRLLASLLFLGLSGLGEAFRLEVSTDSLANASGLSRTAASAAWLPNFDHHPCPDTRVYPSGQAYFRELYHELDALSSGSEVIISGWWFNVEDFYLLGRDVPESRCDRLLKRIAERGVVVYVQLWYTFMNVIRKGPGEFMMTGTEAKILRHLHPNIHVFIDMGRSDKISVMWSWHIKAVVIDRKIAFVGGMDLYSMVWDTPKFLRPDPRRDNNWQNWADMQVRITGPAARDVANALVTRHTSYCASGLNNIRHWVLNKKIFFREFGNSNFCDLKHIPVVNPDGGGAVGTCSYSACDVSRGPSACVKGSCLCLHGWLPSADGSSCHAKEKEKEEEEEEKGQSNTCRVLLSAHNYRMDTLGSRADIYLEYIHAIGAAEHFILIDNQYFSSGTNEFPGPENVVLRELANKMYAKIDRYVEDGSTFCLVMILASFAETHKYVIKSLFDDTASSQGLVTRIQKYVVRKGLAPEYWRKFFVLLQAGNAMTPEFLHQQLASDNVTDYEPWLKQDMQAQAPEVGEATFYRIYTHAKVLVVDGKVAQVGSANVNDRSLMGTKHGDAEMNVEFKGPTAMTVLTETLNRYTGRTDFVLDGTLATQLGEIAARNNDKLADWFGMDFELGQWRATRQPLFLGVREGDFFKMMEPVFAAPMKRRVSGPRPDLEGIIYPFTRNLWGDPNSKVWEDIVTRNKPKVYY